jgi:Plasmid pRiA4b ORF-3-like protein
MATNRSARPKPTRNPAEFVHQFLIVLSGTNPLVWRRIQIPLTYSFWDLHVAIQDSMGWLDYHLHEFLLLNAKDKVTAIGIPTDEEPGQRPCIPSWKVRVSQYFNHSRYHGLPALYVYDFGDDWEHLLGYEGEEPLGTSVTYPRCLAGARRCPPEDCGGVHGYEDFLAAVSNPAHPEHASSLKWAGESYDPDDFDPAKVVFEDPLKRWKIAFEKHPL